MKTEKVILIFILLAILMQLFDLPGKDFTIIIIFLALSIIYFPFGFYFLSDKGIKNQILGVSIPYGFVYSISVIGILFKIMIWPGADFMLQASAGMNIILLIVIFIIPKKENLLIYIKNIKHRTIIFLITTFLFALPTFEQIIKIKYWSNSEKAKERIESYRDYIDKQKAVYGE